MEGERPREPLRQPQRHAPAVRRIAAALHQRRARAGQAMVELAVGLVAIMVLIGALIQVGRLTHARTLTMARARAAAGADALSAVAPARPLENEYIFNWHPGADGRAYTRDDVTIPATTAVDAVQAVVALSGMAGAPEPPRNPFAGMAGAVDPVGDFALISAEETESVDVLPVIRRLVHNRGEITVESEVWMVWTEGLY